MATNLEKGIGIQWEEPRDKVLMQTLSWLH